MTAALLTAPSSTLSIIDPKAFMPFSMDNLSNEDYHGDRQFESSTGLKEMLRSPAHYRHYKDAPRVERKVYQLGTAIHAALLEPDRFKSDYLVMPDFNRRTKEGKAEEAQYRANNADKFFVTEAELEAITGIAENVSYHRDAMALLKASKNEVSHFWQDEETGIYMKCRTDALTEPCILDVKSTEDASSNAFMRSCANYDYDMSAYIYSAGVQSVTGKTRGFAFLAVEKKAPYQVALYFAPEEMLASGLYRYRKALNRLKDARDSNLWGGYQPTGRCESLEWAYWAFNRP